MDRYRGIVIVTVVTMSDNTELGLWIFPMTITSKNAWDYLVNTPVIARIISLKGYVLRDLFNHVVYSWREVVNHVTYSDSDIVAIDRTMTKHLDRFSLMDFEMHFNNANRAPGENRHPLGLPESIHALQNNIMATVELLGVAIHGRLPQEHTPVYTDNRHAHPMRQYHDIDNVEHDDEPLDHEEAFNYLQYAHSGRRANAPRIPHHSLLGEVEHLAGEVGHDLEKGVEKGVHWLEKEGHKAEEWVGKELGNAERDVKKGVHWLEKEGHKAGEWAEHELGELEKDAKKGVQWAEHEGGRLEKDVEKGAEWAEREGHELWHEAGHIGHELEGEVKKGVEWAEHKGHEVVDWLEGRSSPSDRRSKELPNPPYRPSFRKRPVYRSAGTPPTGFET